MPTRTMPNPELRDLKAELVRRGITQRELARRVGVSYWHVNDVINGHVVLTDRLARDISRATGIPLSVILPSQDGDGA